jgi:hypothetical protein
MYTHARALTHTHTVERVQVIFLIGNKCDLDSQVCADSDCTHTHTLSLSLSLSLSLFLFLSLTLQRDVTREEAQKFAEDNNLIFLEASAKTCVTVSVCVCLSVCLSA